jgi:precorrin-2 dehydrogenase / sirohydrochlorin ferrochelatase
MKHYPVYLNLNDRTVLIVGAGEVALQKIQGLLETGAHIRVVSPDALPEIEALAREGKLEWRRRLYQSSDMDETRLVIAATDDQELQPRIAAEARARGVWVNVVDVPPLCDFIAPAIVNKGEIQIAISTGGASPAMAKFIRQKLETYLGEEYQQLVALIQRYRPDILKLSKDRRQTVWEYIISQRFLDQIKQEGSQSAEARLKEWIHGKSAV